MTPIGSKHVLVMNVFIIALFLVFDQSYGASAASKELRNLLSFHVKENTGMMIDTKQVSVAYDEAVALAKAYMGHASKGADSSTRSLMTSHASATDSYTVGDVIYDVNREGKNTEVHVRLERKYGGLQVIGGDSVVHIDAIDKSLSSTISRTVKNPIILSLKDISTLQAQRRAIVGNSRRELVIYSLASEPILAWKVARHGIASDGTPMVVHFILDAESGEQLAQYSDTKTLVSTGWPKTPLINEVEGYPTAKQGRHDATRKTRKLTADEPTPPHQLNCNTSEARITTGQTMYSGTVNISTCFTNGVIVLKDTERNGHYTVNYCGNPSANISNASYFDGDTIAQPVQSVCMDTIGDVRGDGTSSDSNTAGADAHFGHAATFDFFNETFDRHGIYNNNTGVFSRVHAGYQYNNAYWYDGMMTYGDGDGIGIKPWVSLDIVAHEFTHGVIRNSVFLLPFGESGGLNEATCDIFGVLTDFHTKRPGHNPNYLIGDEIYDKPPYFLRSMIQPSDNGYGYDCYCKEVANITTGIHDIAGVASHFFYLLAEGTVNGNLSKTCNIGDSKIATGNGTVHGIGRDKAGQIWYRALTHYFTSGTDYAGARIATINAASDLYNETEVQAVNDAWTAVNVDTSIPIEGLSIYDTNTSLPETISCLITGCDIQYGCYRPVCRRRQRNLNPLITDETVTKSISIRKSSISHVTLIDNGKGSAGYSNLQERALQPNCVAGQKYSSCGNGCGKVFTSWDELHTAINAYITNKATVENIYGTINCWDVSTGINDMSFLFYNFATFNEPVGCWDTSKVTKMLAMFSSAKSFNQELGNWNTSSVKTMEGMFLGAESFNQALATWDVHAVTSMHSMFLNATAFNQDLIDWNVGLVMNMTAMFLYATSFNQNLSNWDVRSVTSMTGMFLGAESFNQHLVNWDVSSVKSMDEMFMFASSFNGYLGSWNVGSVKTMAYMFHFAESFNQALDQWNVSSVLDMSTMFYGAKSFHQELGKWNVRSVVDMSSMFYGAISFNRDIGNWNVRSVKDMTKMFSGYVYMIDEGIGCVGPDCPPSRRYLSTSTEITQTTRFNQDLQRWDVSSVTAMDSMFFAAKDFNQDISNWNVSSVMSMKKMFNKATSFNQRLCNWFYTLNTPAFQDIFQGSNCPDSSEPNLETKISFCQNCNYGYGMACGGAIAIATNAVVHGNIVTTGAYSTGDGSAVFGDVDSVGAAYLGSNAISIGTIISQGALNIAANTGLQSGVHTGDLYATGLMTLGANSVVIGNIFACSALVPGASMSISGQILIADSALHVPSSNGPKILDYIRRDFNTLNSLAGGKDLESSIINNVLLPGVYNKVDATTFSAGSTFAVSAGRTLTFNGTSSDTWIIKIMGSVAFSGNIALIGGALPSNIQWVANGAFSIGAGSNFYGNILANGAISVAAGASLHGLMYAIADGACSLGAGVRLNHI